MSHSLHSLAGIVSILIISTTTVVAEAGETSENTYNISEITDTSQVEEIKDSFQSDLIRLGSSARITSCDHVFNFVTQGAGRDFSYGASCVIESSAQKNTVMMCDDVMIGKFTLTWTGGITRDWFAHFIQENCPPGG